MYNVNPMQLIQMIKSGSNPQQLLMSILQQQGNNNPILNNAMQFAQNGNASGLETLARNFPLLQRYDGSYAIGACDNLTRTIYLSDELSGQLFKKVLCHEITHAAMFSYSVNLSLQQEQLVADLISTYGEQIVYITNKIFNKLGNF